MFNFEEIAISTQHIRVLIERRDYLESKILLQKYENKPYAYEASELNALNRVLLLAKAYIESRPQISSNEVYSDDYDCSETVLTPVLTEDFNPVKPTKVEKIIRHEIIRDSSSKLVISYERKDKYRWISFQNYQKHGNGKCKVRIDEIQILIKILENIQKELDSLEEKL